VIMQHDFTAIRFVVTKAPIRRVDVVINAPKTLRIADREKGAGVP
jgi:hypothetical protein